MTLGLWGANGGSLHVTVGVKTSTRTGGDMSLHSIARAAVSSGIISDQSENAEVSGASVNVILKYGDFTNGNSGTLILVTGS